MEDVNMMKIKISQKLIMKCLFRIQSIYEKSKILKINYLEICNFCIFKLGTQRITSTIHQNINVFFLFFDNLVEKKKIQ